MLLVRSIAMILRNRNWFSFLSDYLKASPTKTINSLLTLERNQDGLITCHTEEWNHDRETDSSDGFMGKLNEIRKIAAAKVSLNLLSNTVFDLNKN